MIAVFNKCFMNPDSFVMLHFPPNVFCQVKKDAAKESRAILSLLVVNSVTKAGGGGQTDDGLVSE